MPKPLLVLVVLAMLGLTACADDEAPQAGTDAPAAEDTGDGSGGGDDAGGGDDDEGTASAGGAVDDSATLGSAGDALLSPEVPSAVVEVDRSEGARLAADALGVVAEELQEHGSKQVGASDRSGAVPSAEVYTADDLRALAASHRGSSSEPDRVAVYVLVLEGRYEDERVTGVAFAATSFAIFPEQISGGILGLDTAAYEEAVLVHELGHLFGLVDLTGAGEFHEDPEHPGHARSEDSVMYWAIEDVSITNVFRGGPPREFDEADRREMALIRGD